MLHWFDMYAFVYICICDFYSKSVRQDQSNYHSCMSSCCILTFLFSISLNTSCGKTNPLDFNPDGPKPPYKGLKVHWECMPFIHLTCIWTLSMISRLLLFVSFFCDFGLFLNFFSYVFFPHEPCMFEKDLADVIEVLIYFFFNVYKYTTV